MAKEDYVGLCNVKSTQYGEMITVGLNKDDIQKLVNNLNDRGWVNLTLKKSREGKPYLEIYRPKTQVNDDLPDDIF